MKTPEQEAFQARLHPKTIEAVWAEHVKGCNRCQLYVAGETSTLAHVCPEGVQCLNVLMTKTMPKAKRVRAQRPGMWASKEEVKRVTRYVE